jgi:citrate synthase
MSQYVPGLEGVPAVESSICTIDVENRRVVIRGYSLEKLAVEKTYEEVAYLLIYGKLPDDDELRAFRKNLVENRLIEMLKHLPSTTHHIDAVRTGVSALAPYDPDPVSYPTTTSSGLSGKTLWRTGGYLMRLSRCLSICPRPRTT